MVLLVDRTWAGQSFLRWVAGASVGKVVLIPEYRPIGIRLLRAVVMRLVNRYTECDGNRLSNVAGKMIHEADGSCPRGSSDVALAQHALVPYNRTLKDNLRKRTFCGAFQLTCFTITAPTVYQVVRTYQCKGSIANNSDFAVCRKSTTLSRYILHRCKTLLKQDR